LVDRREEMHPDDPLGDPRVTRDVANGERGGIRRDHGFVTHGALELRDHPTLGLEILEYRLDDEICVGEAGEAWPAAHAADDPRGLATIEDALFRRVGRELADRRQALGDSRSVAVACPDAQAA